MKIRVNDDIVLNVPTCWQEVTTGIYQKIVSGWESEKELKDRDWLLLFKILSGFSFNKKIRDDKIEAQIYNCIKFVYTQPMYFISYDPKAITEVTLFGKKIVVPTDLGSLTIEQNMQVRKKMETAKVLDECISTAVAIYLQPLIDESEFDYKRAMELREDVELLPIGQTYAVGFFYLRKLKNFGNDGRSYSNLLRQKLTESVTALLRWQASISSQRSQTLD